MAKQLTLEQTNQVEQIKSSPQPSQVPTLSPRQKAIESLNNQLDKYKANVLPNLLQKHGIDPLQFIQVVLTEIKKNEKLLQAFMENPHSMFASILAGAEIGLIPSDMLGEFYLIPRNMKQSDGK
jgi:hypothetical protein